MKIRTCLALALIATACSTDRRDRRSSASPDNASADVRPGVDYPALTESGIAAPLMNEATDLSLGDTAAAVEKVMQDHAVVDCHSLAARDETIYVYPRAMVTGFVGWAEDLVSLRDAFEGFPYSRSSFRSMLPIEHQDYENGEKVFFRPFLIQNEETGLKEIHWAMYRAYREIVAVYEETLGGGVTRVPADQEEKKTFYELGLGLRERGRPDFVQGEPVYGQQTPYREASLKTDTKPGRLTQKRIEHRVVRELCRLKKLFSPRDFITINRVHGDASNYPAPFAPPRSCVANIEDADMALVRHRLRTDPSYRPDCIADLYLRGKIAIASVDAAEAGFRMAPFTGTGYEIWDCYKDPSRYCALVAGASLFADVGSLLTGVTTLGAAAKFLPNAARATLVPERIGQSFLGLSVLASAGAAYDQLQRGKYIRAIEHVIGGVFVLVEIKFGGGRVRGQDGKDHNVTEVIVEDRNNPSIEVTSGQCVQDLPGTPLADGDNLRDLSPASSVQTRPVPDELSNALGAAPSDLDLRKEQLEALTRMGVPANWTGVGLKSLTQEEATRRIEVMYRALRDKQFRYQDPEVRNLLEAVLKHRPDKPIMDSEMPIIFYYEIGVLKHMRATGKSYEEAFRDLTSFSLLYAGKNRWTENLLVKEALNAAGAHDSLAFHRVIGELVRDDKFPRTKGDLLSALAAKYQNPDRYSRLDELLFFFNDVLPNAPAHDDVVFSVVNLKRSTNPDASEIQGLADEYFKRGVISTATSSSNSLAFLPPDWQTGGVLYVVKPSGLPAVPIVGRARGAEQSLQAQQIVDSKSPFAPNEIVLVPGKVSVEVISYEMKAFEFLDLAGKARSVSIPVAEVRLVPVAAKLDDTLITIDDKFVGSGDTPEAFAQELLNRMPLGGWSSARILSEGVSSKAVASAFDPQQTFYRGLKVNLDGTGRPVIFNRQPAGEIPYTFLTTDLGEAAGFALNPGAAAIGDTSVVVELSRFNVEDFHAENFSPDLIRNVLGSNRHILADVDITWHIASVRPVDAGGNVGAPISFAVVDPPN